MKPLTSLIQSCFFIFSVLFLPLALVVTPGLAITTNASELPSAVRRLETPPLVSVTIQNTSIQQAALLIKEKTNYRIKLQSIDLNERVSGHFVEADIETVCANLLKGYNLLIVTDMKQRLITVKSLGPKANSGMSGHLVNDGVQTGVLEQNFHEDGQKDALPLGNDAEIGQFDPFTGMAYADITALHHKQVVEIEQDQQNEETVEPFTGMTYAEIKTLHERQEKALAGTQP